MNILVTGGASGLGKEITRILAKSQGDVVYFTFCNSAKNAEILENECKNVKGLFCDFEDNQSIELLLLKIEELKPDILINNAMTGFQQNHFHKLNSEYFSNSFSKNVLPVIRITQKCISLFRKQKSGKIITILSSFIINKPPIGLSVYVAEKNYLLSMSKSWAAENANFNITSNCISPSYMITPLTLGTDERIVEEMIKSHPLKQLLVPEEVAETVNFLAHCTKQINGSNIIINSASDVI